MTVARITTVDFNKNEDYINKGYFKCPLGNIIELITF